MLVAGSSVLGAVLFVAKEDIQVHLGIRSTWEQLAHLHHRRTGSAQLPLEPPRRVRDALVALLAAS